MATFNSLPVLSTGATGPDALGLNGGGQSLGIEAFDQDLNFDDTLLESVNGGLPTLPFAPSYDFENFSTTFEDPFSYPATRPYDAITATGGVDTFDGDVASPQELDNKLLGFGPPIVKASMVSDSAAGGQYAELGMSAELYGMFFVAEDVFGGENNPARPLELTCYRRNLWQCSGQITLSRNVSAVVDEQGQHVPIFELAASITAIESIEGKSTEIISIPWKSSSANTAGGIEESTKVAGAPPTIPLDLGGQEIDGTRITVPVGWKRLQFKHATANNGRRKGLQQHYVVQINLLGKTKSGEFIKIGEIQSGPVIVRGRSPRNFDSRKDVPLTGDKKLERRSIDASAPNVSPIANSGSKTAPGDLAQNLQRYHSLGNIQQSGDWAASQMGYHQQQQQQNQHQNKKVALSPSLTRPPVPSWSSDNSINAKHAQSISNKHSSSGPQWANAAPTLPINLSLSEDERSPNRATSGDLHSPQFSKSRNTINAAAAARAGHNPNGSPLETEDMLYEYFPLSLDDWMPPVDAIYRPHVVHHTIVPPEVKAQQTRSKTKRYFAAD